MRAAKPDGIDTADGGDIMILELLPTQTVAFIAAFPQGIGSEVFIWAKFERVSLARE